MADQNNQQSDMSPTAVSIARTFDRLPAGDYIIKLNKPMAKHHAWTLEILDTNFRQAVKLNGRPDV